MSVVKFLARPWHSFALHRQEASDPWQPFAIYCHHACCKNGKSDWCWGYRDIQAAFHAEKFHANWLVLLPEKQGCLACIVVAIYEFWLRTEMHCTLAVQRCPSSQKRLRNCPKKIDNHFFYHRSTTWKDVSHQEGTIWNCTGRVLPLLGSIVTYTSLFADVHSSAWPFFVPFS